MSEDSVDNGVFGSEAAVNKERTELAANILKDVMGPGAEEITLGEKRSAYPIPQYKGAEGRKDVFSIITSHAIAVKTHWEEGKGRIFCIPGNACCAVLGPPDLRYVIPIVVYDTDGRGNLLSNKLKLMFLKIDREKYEHFVNLLDAKIDPTTRDFVVTCSSAQYQKLAFTTLNDAAWRKDPAIEKAVIAEFKRLAPMLRIAIAKDVTEAEFLRRHGVGSVPEQSTSGFDLKKLV